MSESLTVVQALTAVMADVGAIGKNRVNEQQRFNFRGIDDVMNALHGPLAKHGVLVLPKVRERLSETRETAKGGVLNVVHLRVLFTFHGPAGDVVEAETWGEAQDSADKATNKALSAAFKYAMLQVFCIPTNEMDDADRTTVDAAPRRREQPSEPLPPPAVQARSALWKYAQTVGFSTAQELADRFADWSKGEVLGSADELQVLAFLAELRKQNEPPAEVAASNGAQK